MAWWHSAKPGDKIVCVDDTAAGQYLPAGYKCLHHHLDGLRLGSVYTVRSIEPHEWLPEHIVVLLAEIERPIDGDLTYETGFSVHRFRPVEPRKTDISIFTDMLRSEEREREASDEALV